jgi:hypothetical protein
VGVGGGSIGLKKQQDNLKRHWELLVDKLERYDLVRGHDFRPVGHSYYLRSSSPAIRSGINPLMPSSMQPPTPHEACIVTLSPTCLVGGVNHGETTHGFLRLCYKYSN